MLTKKNKTINNNALKPFLLNENISTTVKSYLIHVRRYVT